MEQAFSQIMNTIRAYYGSGFYLPLTLTALFYLLWKRKSAERTALAVYGLLVLASFFLPPVYLVTARFFREGMVYWRYLWLLPYMIFIAAAAADLVSDAGSGKRTADPVSDPGSGKRTAEEAGEQGSAGRRRALQGLMVLFLLVLFAAGGRSLYTKEIWQESPSREKVSIATLQCLEGIRQNRKATGDSYARLAAPSGVMNRIRQVDPTVVTYVGRNLSIDNMQVENPRLYRRLMILNGAQTAEGGKFGGHFRINGTNYVMVFDASEADQNLTDTGFHVVSEGDGWKLWYNPVVVDHEGVVRSDIGKYAD